MKIKYKNKKYIRKKKKKIQLKNETRQLKITIAIQCFLFEKRLNWMLSSILQQTGILPEIEVDIAYLKNSGNPETTDVLDYFESEGLKIKRHEYPDISRLQYRGLTRNDQIKDCNTDFILFSDGDHVHCVSFFAEMNKLLLNEFKNCITIMGYKRKSTFSKETEELINGHTYPNNILDAFVKASKLKYRKMPFRCGGGTHLVSTELIREKNCGLYVPEDKCRDFNWEKRYACAKSDMYFRKKIKCCHIPLPRVVHLQHVRSRDNKENLYIQK